MIPLILLFVFIFGIVIGSFLNVVIYRYNTGVSINGRSGCMTCGHQLRWYELIPVVSFLIQGGKCRVCSSKLSWQYPLVELLTGVLFLGTFVHIFGIHEPFSLSGVAVGDFLLMLISWSLLVVILVYDLKHKIIPDGLVYAFAISMLVRIFLTVPFHPSSTFFSYIIAGPLLFLPFFILWFISSGRWIGLGDGKLALGMGWMLGLGLGISSVVLAFWIGAAVSIAIMVIAQLKMNGKKLTMKSEIPFAPFLILGLVLVYFLGIDVIGFHSLFML